MWQFDLLYPHTSLSIFSKIISVQFEDVYPPNHRAAISIFPIYWTSRMTFHFEIMTLELCCLFVPLKINWCLLWTMIICTIANNLRHKKIFNYALIFGFSLLVLLVILQSLVKITLCGIPFIYKSVVIT